MQGHHKNLEERSGTMHSHLLVTMSLSLLSSILTSFLICASCASYTPLCKHSAGIHHYSAGQAQTPCIKHLFPTIVSRW